MAQQYVVVHAFQDKYTKKYYGVGSMYESTDENRAFDLENGGYIVQDNTEMASMAKAQAKGEEYASQNAQNLAEAHKLAQQEIEPKTIINGKVVPVQQAQAAEASFGAMNTQTGVQDHHANYTEAVRAGQISEQAFQNAQQAMQRTNGQINQANVQSGQQALEQEMQQVQQQSSNQSQGMGAYTQDQYAQEAQAQGMNQQEAQEKAQQAAQGLGARAEFTNVAEAEADEAGLSAKKATARAKTKGNQ
jgi:hypothetical protein